MPYPYTNQSYTPPGTVDPASERSMYPTRGILGTVSAPFPTPAAERLKYAQEQRESGEDLVSGLVGQTYKMDRGEYALQTRFMADQVNEFDTRMAMLNNVSQRMDPLAQKRLAEITKRHAGLQSAMSSGRITQLEMFRGAAQLNQELSQFNWQAHVKGKGGAVGDTYLNEEEGIWYHNEAGKGPVPIDYSEEGRKKRTTRDPVTGVLTVPVAPGKDPKVYLPHEVNDLDAAAKRENDLAREISKLASEMAAADVLGKKTPEQHAQTAMSMVIASREQAKLAMAKLYGTEGNLTGEQQKKQVEQEMGLAAPPSQTVAAQQAAKVQQKQTEQKDAEWDKQADKLIDEHAKLFNIPKGSAQKAIKLGYSKDQIIRALGAFNQMKHYFPNANNVNDLPPEWQTIFQQSLPILQALKGK